MLKIPIRIIVNFFKIRESDFLSQSHTKKRPSKIQNPAETKYKNLSAKLFAIGIMFDTGKMHIKIQIIENETILFFLKNRIIKEKADAKNIK